MSRAGHLIDIAGGWAVWKWLRVRGAGFPATGVLNLASPELAAEADRVLAAEALIEERRQETIAALEAALPAASPEQRKQLVAQLRRLRAGRIPDPSAVEAASLHAASTELVRARQALAERFVEANRQAGEALRATLRSERFREALIWQNRRALHAGLDSLLAAPAGTGDKETRKRELTVATYLQRYSVKNDTIGFFGPVCWGRFRTEGEPFTMLPGRALLARRTVYFEQWSIRELAASLAADPRLAPWLAPRRLPGVRVEGTTLHYPIEKTAELPLEPARILAACDGLLSARVLAAELAEDPQLDLAGEEEVFELLGDLEAKKLITWTLEVPTQDLRPELALRRVLESVGDDGLREEALAALDRLEHARTQVAAAAGGDPVNLDRALENIEQTFTALTGAESVRRGGETYAGRTLIYEDCVRDLDLQLGPGFLSRLEAPLALLLQSARWYTYAVAEKYRTLLGELHRRLAEETGSTTVDYLRFWQSAALTFGDRGGPVPAPVAEAAAELRRRWSSLLALSPDAREVRLSASSLRDPVAEIFAAPHPGWPSARHHSPDILIGAKSLQAAQRGDYFVVLGELHLAVNTLLTPMALVHHERFEDLLAAREIDLELPGISAVESSANTMRADNFSLSPRDYHVELGTARSWRPRAQVIAAADVVVAGDDPAHLSVRTRDGSKRFDLIHFFQPYLSFAAVQEFALVERARHVPRIAIDALVIQREQWRFTPEELTAGGEDAGPDRFLAARRFARAHGLPRMVFVKIPEEPKPIYLDFASPHSAELFAKLARKASAMTISEMLPALEDTWLTDQEGRTHTFEVRFAVRDPQAWIPGR